MLFSVIIPAYKMGRYIGDALDSVAAQSCKEWEIIVVDDCAPDDGTAKIVKGFIAKHPSHRIELIRHEKNTGVSGARNTAIAAAKGKFLAFLDPDDYWLPEYLARMKSALAESPETCAVASPMEAFHSTDHGEVIEALRFEAWQINQFPASLAVANFIPPSSTVVLRAAALELGGFDTNPDIQHIEDYDLWIRLAKAGRKFTFVNENLSRYRRHSESATSNTWRMWQLHEFLAHKHAAFFISCQSQIMRQLMSERTRLKDNLRNPLRAVLRRVVGK